MNSIDEQKMQFILTIRSKGVVDKNVLNALETVNRPVSYTHLTLPTT